MLKGTMFDGGQSFDLISSKVIRFWLGIEALLTLISIILLFFLPGTAGGLLIIIFFAVLLTFGVVGFLFVRYSSLAVVKNKRTYLTEKAKLLNKVSKIKMELAKIEGALASNQANENQEIERALQKIHKEYIENGLCAAKIESGEIPGVGPKLKEKLKANRICSAADIGLHIQNLEGFGSAKVQALISWKGSILAQLDATKPRKLPEAQLSEIQRSHNRTRDNLSKTRESHQLQQTELGLELETVNRNLHDFVGVNFINYLSINLFGGIKNNILQKSRTPIMLSVIGLGALVHAAFGMVSTGALIVASVPTPTLTPIPTLTFTITVTSTATPTPTLKPTLTLTVSSTATSSPTITQTPTITFIPSPTLIPTEDLSFYDLASCIPRNTLVQKGTVVQVIDGDTIHVRLEDGNTYSVRYIGTDSPETGRPFYIETTKANSDMVLNKDVILVKDQSETDQYDRLLRYVIVQNKFVNLEMVRKGYAVAETYPPDVACSDTFSSAQKDAQVNLFGIWASTPTPVPSASQVIIVAVDKRDEYVDIKNVGNSDVDLAGWNLVSEKGNQDCPLSGIIKAGDTMRIWSMNSQGGGYYCGYNSPIWNNSEPDPAVLYNAQGVEVSRW